MTINSRAKGRAGELELCRILAAHWPEAKPNLDQFATDKRDVVNVAGTHWQVKRVERLNIWAALDQAMTEATATDLPVLAFRRNFTRSHLPSRSMWFGALALDELVALLRLREASA